jgi:hypothetical protein
MTPKTLIWLVLATTAGAASCAVIRYFDELQSGGAENGGDGSTGDGGDAGTTAAAGAAKRPAVPAPRAAAT